LWGFLAAKKHLCMIVCELLCKPWMNEHQNHNFCSLVSVMISTCVANGSKIEHAFVLVLVFGVAGLL